MATKKPDLARTGLYGGMGSLFTTHVVYHMDSNKAASGTPEPEEDLAAQPDPSTAEEKTLPEGYKRLSASDLAERKLFPKDWALIGVRGKDAFTKKWATEKKRHADAICDVKTYSKSTGMGVVTGALSGGLIAMDIDGAEAEKAYKLVAGAEYEAVGEEKTMAWTSGKPNRRVMLWRLPEFLIETLAHVTVLQCDKKGVFHGHNKSGEIKIPEGDRLPQELALRFNRCMCVLPGSIHPDTKPDSRYHYKYRFLQYNGGMPAEAPEWLVDVMRGHRQAAAFLPEEDLAEFKEENFKTLVPPKQIRGWFFSNEDVRKAWTSSLQELIFKHPVFDKYGWVLREGENPQMMSGCPWHESSSGTSFQYAVNSGCWDCKSCGVSGDPLDFIHKIRTDDMNAGKPDPESLEKYVSEIATKIGFKYPEELLQQYVVDAPMIKISSREFLEQAKQIIKTVTNPAEQSVDLLDLAERSGRRLTPSQTRALIARYNEFERNKDAALTVPQDWTVQAAPEDYIIPGLLRRPSQIMFHAKGGVGKTETAMALAKAIGRGEVLNVRGIPVQCVKGDVLWISLDQSKTRLAAQLMRQDIDPMGRDKWFHLNDNWRVDLPDVFTKMMKEIKPALVVIDSLGATSDLTDAKENEAAYAQPLYDISQRNGDEEREDGFPAAAIVWIHHNTKDNAGFRGTDRLNNAVDETWTLRALDEEQEQEFGTNSRLLTIGKSRYERSGDRLLVTRDLDLNYEIKDLTPTLTRAGVGRNGALEPMGVVLEVLKAAGAPLTKEEVREGVKAYIQGEGGDQFPKEGAIRKYLACWITDGLVAVEEVKLSGGKGRPSKRYFLIRVEGEREHTEIDWDSRDSWPRLMSEFLYDPMRIVQKIDSAPSVQKMPGDGTAPPETASDFPHGHFLHGTSDDRAEIQTPFAATDLDSDSNFCTESPGLRARGERSSGAEGAEPLSWDDAFGSLDQYDL